MVKRQVQLESHIVRLVAALSVVVAEDEIGDAARLCLALDLVDQPVDGLRAIAQVLHLGELHVHADSAVDLQARWKADPC